VFIESIDISFYKWNSKRFERDFQDIVAKPLESFKIEIVLISRSIHKRIVQVYCNYYDGEEDILNHKLKTMNFFNQDLMFKEFNFHN
jgi:hypothetical protein